jgi:hypothetical protein
MDQLTGRPSSTSPPTTWHPSHSGPHFTMTVFPDGRLILTTPDNLDIGQFEQIKALMGDWINAERPFPLVIGQCQVIFSPVEPRAVEIRR